MTTNNFDQSSTGTNLELSIFRDIDMAQTDFDENFETIDAPPYYRSSRLFYTGQGEDEKPKYLPDCYDFSACTYRDFRAFCLEQGCSDAIDTVQHKFDNFNTWEDYAVELLYSVTISEAMRDGFPSIANAPLLYVVSTATGYCQGDYAEILHKPLTFEVGDMFDNLLFNQPVYIRLDVDGEEYQLEDSLKDSYEYEKEDVLKYCKETLKLDNKILTWLELELPEYI